MDFIESLIQEELKKASNYATRATIKMRVVKRIIQMMGMTFKEIHDTKDCIHVDPSISDAVEHVWKGGSYMGEHFQTTQTDSADEFVVFERFLAKDFVKPIDIVKLTSTLQKRYPSSSVTRILWFLFAVDGLYGEPLEFYAYNLTVPLILGERFDNEMEREDWMTAHVRAIRTIYRDVRYASPEILGITLRKLLGESKKETSLPRRRGDGSSSPSSESSSSSSSGDEEVNDSGAVKFDRFIADLYKKLVGTKIHSIAFQVQNVRGGGQRKIIKAMPDETQPIAEEPKKQVVEVEAVAAAAETAATTEKLKIKKPKQPKSEPYTKKLKKLYKKKSKKQEESAIKPEETTASISKTSE